MSYSTYELKNKIKEYKSHYAGDHINELSSKNGLGSFLPEWEKKLLYDLNIIGDSGIIPDHPVAYYLRNGVEETLDVGGNIDDVKIACNEATKHATKDSEKAKIKFVPRNYVNYLEAKKQIAMENIAMSFQQEKQAIPAEQYYF